MNNFLKVKKNPHAHRSHLTFTADKEGTGIYHTKTYAHLAVLALAKCEDGVVRTIRLNQSPDTFFSHPGRTTIQKKSVRGFVSFDDSVLYFTAYKKES